MVCDTPNTLVTTMEGQQCFTPTELTEYNRWTAQNTASNDRLHQANTLGIILLASAGLVLMAVPGWGKLLAVPLGMIGIDKTFQMYGH